ncbi:MAG: glycosyltransferase 87 family protein [Ferrimicrobium sp.]
MDSIRARVDKAQHRLASLNLFEQDGLLYLGAAILALGNLFVAAGSDYRQWALIATAPYAVGAAVSLIVGVRRGRRGMARFGAKALLVRRGLIVALFVACVVAPLTLAIIQRSLATPGSHAQAEVAVIERCGDRVFHNHNCYLTQPTTAGTSVRSDAPTLDANAFVPYLPGIIPFGLANALPLPTPLRDARVAMATFTIAVVILALSLARISSGQRWRIFQVAIVLPTGALPMVTGGDDLPVIAILLLGFILTTRRQPRLAGLVLGLASIMKLTAWPLALLLILVQRDRRGDRAPRAYLSSLAAVVIPVIGVTVLINPRAFLVNELLFPLGLTSIKSPAQSPLIGQEIISFFPHNHLAVVGALVITGAGIVALAFWRYRPRTPSAVAALCAFAFLMATLLAPATRFGYLLYPANLFAWAVLYRKPRRRARREYQPYSIAQPISHQVLTAPSLPDEIAG